jgi:hypothetical protein
VSLLALPSPSVRASLDPMKLYRFTRSRKLSLCCGALLFLKTARPLMAEPTPAAVSAFNTYAVLVESRLALQHRSANTFLASCNSDPSALARLRHGDLLIEQLAPATGGDLSGSLLYHWRGTAFAPGATAADFERLMQNFKAYPQAFAPEVLQAGTIAHTGGRFQAWMRIRQHHVITVAMDSAYDIAYGRLDLQHGYSISRSTRIAELDSSGASGAPFEHALPPAAEHGFLYRLNTYWSYEERDGGLYLQIETVSLTRSIPRGLAWAVSPYIQRIPRESLEFTLNSARNALHK